MEFSVGQVLLCEKLEHKGKAWRRNGKCSVSYKRKETELVILCLTVSLGMWGYEGSHPCTLSLSHQRASSPCLSPYGPLSLLSGSCINRMIETLLLKKSIQKRKAAVALEAPWGEKWGRKAKLEHFACSFSHIPYMKLHKTYGSNWALHGTQFCSSIFSPHPHAHSHYRGDAHTPAALPTQLLFYCTSVFVLLYRTILRITAIKPNTHSC